MELDQETWTTILRKRKYQDSLIILHGSRARGEATEKSDYDVLEIFNGNEPLSQQYIYTTDRKKFDWTLISSFEVGREAISAYHEGLEPMIHSLITGVLIDGDRDSFLKISEFLQEHKTLPNNFQFKEPTAIRLGSCLRKGDSCKDFLETFQLFQYSTTLMAQYYFWNYGRCAPLAGRYLFRRLRLENNDFYQHLSSIANQLTYIDPNAAITKLCALFEEYFNQKIMVDGKISPQ